MGYARKHLISLQDTPYYHCVARCVRRAWLWGFDEYARKDYSHRKQWIIDRLAQLSQIFAIEICAYAVMSNHYHLVLFVDPDRCRHWSAREVTKRWEQLFHLPPYVETWRDGTASEAEAEQAERTIETWRKRLHDISWFMRCLNEHLARLANAEDGCDGRFWQGRFRSQALLDEAGLLTAMAYVDLNPIRAGIARSPEESPFTSIYERIRSMRRSAPSASSDSSARPHTEVTSIPLRRFKEAGDEGSSLPYRLNDYLQLVDWSGRAVRDDKRGHIDMAMPPILQRLNIEPEAWRLAMRPRGNVFGRALGRLDVLRLHAATLGQEWIRGLRQAERMYAN